MRQLKLEGEDGMKGATERIQRETDLAVAEERRRWNQDAKAKKKRAKAW